MEAAIERNRSWALRRPILNDEESDAALIRYGFAVCEMFDTDDMLRLNGVLEDVGHAPDDPRVAMYFGFFSGEPQWKRRVFDNVLELLDQSLSDLFADCDAYFAMFVTKWPGSLGSFAPHQDPSYVDERRHRTMTLWCPLTATGVIDGSDNGQLCLVPGSHLLGPDVRVNDTSYFAHRGSEPLILSQLGVGVPTQPGQAIVFDNRTIHYSRPNRSSYPRTVLAVGLRPVGAQLYHYGLSAGDPERIDVHEIDDDYFVDFNPLRVQLEEPGSRLSGSLPAPRPIPDHALMAACAEAGRPGFAVAGSDEQMPDTPYCFMCGRTEELLRSPDAPPGGMAVCAGCVGASVERYSVGRGFNGVPGTEPAPAPRSDYRRADRCSTWSHRIRDRLFAVMRRVGSGPRD